MSADNAAQPMIALVLTQFNKLVNIDNEYSLKELKDILGEVFKDVKKSIKDAEKEAKAAKAAKAVKADKKPKKADNDDKADKPRKQRTKRERDENGEIIKKREPSAYNLFIKEQSAIIKAGNPDLDSKAIFKMAIDEWKKKKEQMIQADDANEADDAEDEPKAVETKPVSDAKVEPQQIEEPNPTSAPKVEDIQQDAQPDAQHDAQPDVDIDAHPKTLKPKKAARKPKKAATQNDDEM